MTNRRAIEAPRASAQITTFAAENGITRSMGLTGICWDNAMAESFFATLKTELVYRHKWAGRAELRGAVFDYIEVFYNRQRLHSALDYRTPAEAEDAYVLAAALRASTKPGELHPFVSPDPSGPLSRVSFRPGFRSGLGTR